MENRTKKTGAIQVGDPIIRNKARPVSTEMLGLAEVKDCLLRMDVVNTAMKGVGISANQVGCDLRISMICIQPGPNRPELKFVTKRIMVNPILLPFESASEFMWEGCLSVAEANLFVKVKRFKKVKVHYLDLNGQEVTDTLKGLEAHVAQHELDHLDGRIFLDCEFDSSTFMSASEYRKMRKVEKLSKGEVK